MKTNRFDETIRKKLESIEPVFEEQDWTKMKDYLQMQGKPSFWKVYSHWIAYSGVAASLVVTSGLWYTQFRENQSLKKSLVELQQVIAEKADVRQEVRVDTLVIVKEVPVPSKPDPYPARPAEAEFQPADRQESPVFAAAREQPDRTAPGSRQENGENIPGEKKPAAPDFTELNKKTAPAKPSGTGSTVTEEINGNAVFPTAAPGEGIAQTAPPAGKEIRTQEATVQDKEGSRRFSVPVKGEEKVAVANPPAAGKNAATPEAAGEKMETAAVTAKKQPHAAKSESPEPERTKEAARALPDFITRRNYRLGMGFSWSQNRRTTQVLNEVILNPALSVTWGLSHVKYKRMRYVNDVAFWKQTKEDFHENFGKTLSRNSEVLNIVTYSTLMQLPVAVTYRQDLGKGFSLLLGAGTDVNLRFRQHLSYSLLFKYPYVIKEQSDLQFKKASFPVLNNLNLSAGFEKNFDPVVIQGEVYYMGQRRDVPYIGSNSGVGARLKMMLQFGRKI